MKLILFWIDEDIDNEENSNYIKELESFYSIKVMAFKDVISAIDELKKIRFKETKIIINGQLYNEFVRMFKMNLKDIYVAPKIIVFTKHKKVFVENHKDFIDSNNIFYSFCGVVESFDDIIKFCKNEITSCKLNIPDDAQLTFEYIDKKEKLVLPLFFKALIENSSNKDMEKYTSNLYKKYSNKSDKIKNLLGSIESIPNIPIEILSKYYARLYTCESEFYRNINKELGSNTVEKYLPYIKTLYEGVKFQSLPLCKEKKLYRGSKISKKEINIIKTYMQKKIKGLPSSIVFSKSFLSFSKEKENAERFLKMGDINKDLFRVLFVLEKDDEIGYNLATHGDLEEISFFPSEKEVLFFPFSSFELKDIKEIKIGNEKCYEIKLLYLGKYLKDIEKDKRLVEKASQLPESEFKVQLLKVGLINEEKIKKMDTKIIYNSYKKYEKEVEEINDSKINKIVGEVKINIFKINEDIQVINSYENVIKNNKENNRENMAKKDDMENKNKKEIEENIVIKINGKIQDFSYVYNFKKEGTYKIEYIFKNPLTKTNHMFFGCEYLSNLDFSNFNTKKVTNMRYMFRDCKSLKNLDLSNFYTRNVTNMSNMFAFCNSLNNLNLSNFNTENVIAMNNMFESCHSLVRLDLSSFNIQKVTDISEMFYDDESLKYLNLSNFHTQNNIDLNNIFYNCKKLHKKNVIINDSKIKNELSH